MSKILEIIGIVLVAIMSLAFVGALDTVIPLGIENGLSPLFWGCAGATLMIILYRKKKRKQAGLE
ncbi:MAG: hypothetical protein H2B07_03980 [Nitrosopumilaceae archaeon]|nr:hypothetical protein [Nitrosopumilaceae archaeon]MBA4448030.1 hypothetical protein [Nitrosopumilaceae archaeon]